MHKAIDSFFNTNKDTKVSDGLDLSLDNRSWRGLFFQCQPRVGFQLLHAKTDTAIGDINIKHYDIHGVVNSDDFRRMFHSLRPAHFTDVNEAFNAFFKFHKSAVVGKADDFSSEFLAYLV